MSTYWRLAGLKDYAHESGDVEILITVKTKNYIQFSKISANVVRRVLKPEYKVEAEKRSESFIKGAKWINGKPDLPLKKSSSQASSAS